MKINFDAVLKDFKGDDIADEKGAGVVLSMIAINAILSPEQGQTGLQKKAAFDLAAKISTKPEGEYLPEEAVLIKEAIGKHYPALIVGAAYNLLDA